MTGLVFRVQAQGLWYRALSLGFRVEGQRFETFSFASRFKNLGLRVHGLRFKIWNLRFTVMGLGFTKSSFGRRT